MTDDIHLAGFFIKNYLVASQGIRGDRITNTEDLFFQWLIYGRSDSINIRAIAQDT